LETIIGFIGFLLAFIFLLLLTYKFKSLNLILFIGFGLRVLAAFYHTYIHLLPDYIDPQKFESLAWTFGKEGIFEAFLNFGKRGSGYIYMHFVSLMYAFIGRSVIFIQMIHVLVGLINIILTYKLSYLIWEDNGIAKKAAWFVAVFPTLIMYSALTNREVFISMFFLISMIYVVKWIKTENNYYFVISLLLFLTHYYLHGPLILGILPLLVIFLNKNLLNGLSSIRESRINYLFLFSIIFILIIFVSGGILWAYVSIPYIGSLNGVNYSLIFNRVLYLNSGGAAYPQWLMPNDFVDLFTLTIPRIVYLFFSPLPWDIRTMNQLLGLIDSGLYVYLFYNIYKLLKLKDKPLNLSSIFVILGFIFVVYSWGVSNYGTGLRHRAKFVPVLIALAAVNLPKIKIRDNFFVSVK
jgi:hypothetical protein